MSSNPKNIIGERISMDEWNKGIFMFEVWDLSILLFVE